MVVGTIKDNTCLKRLECKPMIIKETYEINKTFFPCCDYKKFVFENGHKRLSHFHKSTC